MTSQPNNSVGLKMQQRLKGLSLLPRSLLVLNLFAVVLFVVLVIVGAGAFRQTQLLNQVFTDSSVNGWRGLVQADRQVLLLRTLVVMPPSAFDLDAFQQQRAVVESRFDVIRSAQFQAAISDELKTTSQGFNDTWSSLQDDLDQLEANPDDTALRETLGNALIELSRGLIASDVTLQRDNLALSDEVGKNNLRLLTGVLIFVAMFVVFAVAVGVSLYRFFRQRQAADENAARALAAEAAAREANTFKDQFFSTMSHELRTPLNGIIGFLGVLNMTEELTPQQSRYVDRTRANAERLLMLINDLLDLSKIEAGRLDVYDTTINIRNLVQKWQTQIEILARDKQLAFNVNVDERLPQEIVSDEEALTKISTNLLSNAIKFTEKGSVNLSVRQQDKDLVIEVTDTGIGIPTHMQELIFESFRQADSSTRRKYGGSGLGLSIAQRLCRVLDGTIRVKSTTGTGSTFTVTVPLRLPNSVSAALPVSAAAPGLMTPSVEV